MESQLTSACGTIWAGDIGQLAAWFGVTYSTIWKRKKGILHWIATGEFPACKKTGRRPLITPEIREFVEQLLDRDPTLYLDEIADYI